MGQQKMNVKKPPPHVKHYVHTQIDTLSCVLKIADMRESQCSIDLNTVLPKCPRWKNVSRGQRLGESGQCWAEQEIQSGVQLTTFIKSYN